MNKEEQIIDYLNGALSDQEKSDLERQLKSDLELQDYLEEYKTLYKDLDGIVLEKPSDNLQYNFDKLLESNSHLEDREAKHIPFRPMKYIKQISAVAAVLVVGVLVGINYNQGKVIDRMDTRSAEVLEKMQSDIQTVSVSGRIGAVQVSQEIAEPEDEILETLIKVMVEDESPNVRLAAAEALEQHTSSPKVREAMVKRLNDEQDPFVLIALINTLSQKKEASVIKSLKEITEKEGIQQFIKDEAHFGLLQIEKI